MPRYIFIDRKSGKYAGDTQEVLPDQDFDGPVSAAKALDAAAAEPVHHHYQVVSRGNKRAVFDVYTMPNGATFTTIVDGSPPQNNPAYWIERECRYVTSLARG